MCETEDISSGAALAISGPDRGYICPTDVGHDWTYYSKLKEKNPAEKGLLVKCAGRIQKK